MEGFRSFRVVNFSLHMCFAGTSEPSLPDSRRGSVPGPKPPMDHLTHLSGPLGTPPRCLTSTSNPTCPTQTSSWLNMFFWVFLVFPISVVCHHLPGCSITSKGITVPPVQSPQPVSQLSWSGLPGPFIAVWEGACLAQPQLPLTGHSPGKG